MSAVLFDTASMESMMDDAVRFCAEKVSLKGKEQVLEALRCGDCAVCEYVRYGLAKGVAEYMGSVNDTIKVVYTYEPEYATSVDEPIPSRPNLTPGINLIAWVSHSNDSLSSVVASVGSAVSEMHRRLACPKANAACHQLDVKVADDGEVRGRTGYGALVNSLYVRPMKIWSK